MVIGRFEENNGGGRIRISGSGFEEKNNGGEGIGISGSGFEENGVVEGQSVSGVVPNGIYCTSVACYQDCPETSLGGESCDALLSVEREVIMDIKEVEEVEVEGEVVKEVKSCEEYNLQIVSQV